MASARGGPVSRQARPKEDTKIGNLNVDIINERPSPKESSNIFEATIASRIRNINCEKSSVSGLISLRNSPNANKQFSTQSLLTNKAITSDSKEESSTFNCNIPNNNILSNKVNHSKDEKVYEKYLSTNNNRLVLETKSNVNRNSINGRNSKDQPPTTPLEFSESTLLKLNSFKFSQNKNTMLREQPNPLNVRPKELLQCMYDTTKSKEFKILFQDMSDKLDSQREQLILLELSNQNGKTKWGSPIKVPTNWNVPLEKSPSEETNPEHDELTNDKFDRIAKRKALCNIGAAIYDSDYEKSDDDDDEFIDKNKKKRKWPQAKQAEEELKRNQEGQKNQATFVNPIEMTEVDDTKDLLDSELFDNSSMLNLHKNLTVNPSIDDELDYKQLQYSGRVVSPNLVKKNFKGPRAKKKNIIRSSYNSKNSFMKNHLLNDEEINKTLNELNEEIDDSDSCVDNTGEKIVSPVSTHLQSKIQMACSYLENVNVAEKQRLKDDEEARKQRELKKQMRKDELMCKRLQEQENENSRELERERNLNKASIYETKSFMKKVTRLNFNKSRQTRSHNDDDSELDISRPNMFECPICKKFFSSDNIQMHAQDCNEFCLESDESNFHEPCSSRYNTS